jgi:2-aminoethylphosphonate-pyruvate transaminase
MRIVILAAGVGRSLYPLTRDKSKSLLEVNGITLLERLLIQTIRLGATPVVVVGYKKPGVLDTVRRVQDSLSIPIDIIENPYYEGTNTLYSLWLARHACRGSDFLVADGDLICDDTIIEAIISDPRNAVLAIDRARVMGDEEVKVVCDDDGRLTKIGKDLTPSSAIGEFIGIAKYSHAVGVKLFAIVGQIVSEGDQAAYYEEAISRLAQDCVVHSVDVAGRPWMEIDVIGDYVEALRMFGDSDKVEALSAMPAIRHQLLFCPGPVLVSSRVKRALVAHEIGHREVEFSELLNRVRLKLGKVFGIRNFHRYTTVVLTGSGSAANEALLGSAGVARRLLIVSNGEFGERLIRIATHLGLEFQPCTFRWGEAFNLSHIDQALTGASIDAIVWVHHETSTGMLNPLGELTALARSHHAETYVDAVSSVGGVPIDIETLGITFCTGSANKAIGSVPGLAFICGRREAFHALSARHSRSLYLDLYNHFHYNDHLHQTPNTPAVNLYFGLEAALDELLEMGLAKRFSHYRDLANRLRAGLRRLGLTPFIPEAAMSPLVTTVRLPSGFDPEDFHERVKNAGYIIYAGKGILRDKVFQIANMGELTAQHVDELLGALSEILTASRGNTEGQSGSLALRVSDNAIGQIASHSS